MTDIGPHSREAGFDVPGPGADAVWRDRPDAYLPGDRRRALVEGRELPENVEGAALFADISGFTPVTEALGTELGSHRASEVLTANLNRVFHAVIEELDEVGGDVIYFSGDAITCWVDGDDGTRATAAALGMQRAMEREGRIVTPAGVVFPLGLKVAVAVGEARRFVVGDPSIQLIDVLAGALIDRLAATEQLTEKGEVVVDAAARAALGAAATTGDSRTSDEAGTVTVVTAVDPLPASGRRPDEVALTEAVARRWLLGPVYDRLAAGTGEFLAELRPAHPVFVSFGGIDYDTDPGAAAKLDHFVRAAQRVLTDHGGCLLQLTLGDKGAYLYAVFGTPLAHEDDPDRACAAALALVALERETAARDVRIGITHGRLRSGTYGHELRRTFVCLGDAVNLSARLMSKAGAGQIYVSELVHLQTGARFRWEQLEPLKLKGKAVPVSAFRLLGVAKRGAERSVRHRLQLIGRERELGVLREAVASARRGRGKIVGVTAEAGMGKSRLVAEFIRETRADGVSVVVGECQSFGAAVSYAVWREPWRVLLGVPENASARRQALAATLALQQLDPSLAQRAPLLGPVLDVPIPDNELTGSFDPKLRKTSLESLLADVLRLLTANGPLVIVLEDTHWLDALSSDLLRVLARTARGIPAAIVAAYRPPGTGAERAGMASLPGIQEVPLGPLDPDDARTFVHAKLVGLVGEEEAAAAGALLEMVVERSQGNPFYAEELIEFVRSSGVDLGDARAIRRLDLPGSLHSLLIGRIDRLSAPPRQTLKVASVVGRSFTAPFLPRVYGELGSESDVSAHLETLRLVDLIGRDREDDDSYLFKHAITHEVAYESLPYALRSRLHGSIVRLLESDHADATGQQLDLLAHHAWHGDDDDRKRLYLRRAAAAATREYANEAAIDYFERVTPLLVGAERVDALMEHARVLDLIGRWDEARTCAGDALARAEELGDRRAIAWAEVSLAETSRRQGRFDEAAGRLDRARGVFEGVGAHDGVGRVLHLAGTLAAQRGNTVEARRNYEASLAIREALGDDASIAALLSNLGIMAEWEGAPGRGLELHERALALRKELGDRWAIAISQTNIGMNAMHRGDPAAAKEPFEQAMQMYVEVGDPWHVALSHHNLANAARALGDRAASCIHFRESLEAYRGLGDRWALAELIEDVALLAVTTGRAEDAVLLLASAEGLRGELGAARSTGRAEELAAGTGTAVGELSEAVRAAAETRGRGLDLDGSVDVALGTLGES